jgi:hypothetical protein
MFRFTGKPSSGSYRQYLVKITHLVQCGYIELVQDVVSVMAISIARGSSSVSETVCAPSAVQYGNSVCRRTSIAFALSVFELFTIGMNLIGDIPMCKSSILE